MVNFCVSRGKCVTRRNYAFSFRHTDIQRCLLNIKISFWTYISQISPNYDADEVHRGVILHHVMTPFTRRHTQPLERDIQPFFILLKKSLFRIIYLFTINYYTGIFSLLFILNNNLFGYLQSYLYIYFKNYFYLGIFQHFDKKIDCCMLHINGLPVTCISHLGHERGCCTDWFVFRHLGNIFFIIFRE